MPVTLLYKRNGKVKRDFESSKSSHAERKFIKSEISCVSGENVVDLEMNAWPCQDGEAGGCHALLKKASGKWEQSLRLRINDEHGGYGPHPEAPAGTNVIYYNTDGTVTYLQEN